VVDIVVKARAIVHSGFVLETCELMMADDAAFSVQSVHFASRFYQTHVVYAFICVRIKKGGKVSSVVFFF